MSTDEAKNGEMDMTLNEAIRDIQENEYLSAEARNALHVATEGHPWCVGQSLEDRKLAVRVILADRRIDPIRMDRVERATT